MASDSLRKPFDYMRRAERAARRWLIPPAAKLSATIELFDCNAHVGERNRRPPGEPTTAKELAAELARLKVKNALVRHRLALETGPAEANRRIAGDLAGLKSLHPAWTLLPESTGETGFTDEAVDAMVAAGARAVWLYPKSHHFSLRHWCAGSMLSTLEYRHVPLFMAWDEVDLDELSEVLGRHENLDVVLTNVNYRSSRRLYPLLAKCANLHMGLGAPHSLSGFVEEVVSRFGPLRLLYGSGYPDHEIGSAIAYLLYADISDEDKRLIGAGNLRSLLEGVS